jgi:hypothetical protein
MANVKEAEVEWSIVKLCARVVSTQGYELQNAIIELSKALESWRSTPTDNDSRESI